jgi:hypothetical protein
VVWPKPTMSHHGLLLWLYTGVIMLLTVSVIFSNATVVDYGLFITAKKLLAYGFLKVGLRC